jgi:LysM repeat protein
LSNSKITKRVLGAGAAVALSAGIGLATASPAHADVWDRVAACESSGNWNISTGNGFYGGLQFTLSTWHANGGSGNPANASVAEQKRVAQNVLRTQGPGAWPVCGPRAGLSRSNGAVSSYSAPKRHSYSYTSRSSSRHSYTPKHSSGSVSSHYSTPRHAKGNGHYVTIKAGDTLAKIAARHGVHGGWQALWSINRNKISNPNFILAGDRIEL